ncbi:MFS-type transporter SLC18B1-like isoform X2 [Zootermopsis nevadensis]|uniref:Putative MFS-type transporter n=1 Tax=Zootermopsis nevadensis TaxID=136037 RepID=A0A067QQL9_ZOONE|nr:MFS-type transporter SLC18B1-like isoform X2 [Zootermopsis nevadensis]KDR11631.1 putative MFS-type transporter [Zootermopsis nevadensis]
MFCGRRAYNVLHSMMNAKNLRGKLCSTGRMVTRSHLLYGFGMEASEVHEGPESSKSLSNRGTERNVEPTSVVPASSTPDFKSAWKRRAEKRNRQCRVRGQRCVRSQSLPGCQLNKYSAGEIRRMRERLLRTQRHPEPGSIRHFSRTQKLALTSLALVDFISFCSMSIMAPFFPKEASRKGMSETISGLVFSFYALVMFVSSPLFGKILPRVGAKFLFMSGMFVAGSCNLLFGMLVYIENFPTFTIYCFLVRGMEALGASAYATASYVFVVDIFPDNIGSVLGILETFVGLGMSIGPALGGILYSVGGFGLPFYTLGILMVVIVPANLCLLPPGDACNMEKKSGSLLELIRVPSVIMISLVIVVISNTWGFLDPTLEPHLREFQLNPEHIGLIFLLFSSLYGVFSLIWGWLADRCNNHWSMMVWGLLICTIGLLLLGPSPLLPFLKNTIWLNLVALSVLGISVALTLLPTFQAVLDSAIEGGCSEDLSTYSLVAGVWSCMYSLGEVTGPSVGGVLLEYYGFPICSTVMACATFVLALVTLVFFVTKETMHQNSSDKITTDSGISEYTSSWDQDRELEHDGVTGSECQEDSPLLASGCPDHDLYTREKVEYYETAVNAEEDNDPDRLLDVRRTVGITGGGACEV